MKNMKVGAKLILSFIVVLALMTLIIVFSILSFTNVKSVLETFYSGPFTMVQAVDNINETSNEAAKHILVAILDPDLTETESRFQRAEECLANGQESIDLMLAEFAGDKNAVKAMDEATDEILETYHELYDLVKEDKADEAYAAYKANIAPAFSVISTNVNACKEFSTNRAQSEYNEGMWTINVSEVVSLIMGIVSVIVGISFALYITKSLSNGINAVESAAKSLAGGNFDVEIKYTSKDEIGQLADSMRDLSGRLGSVIKDIDHVLDEVSQGNLLAKSGNKSMYVGSLHGIFKSIRNLIDKLNSSMTKINNSAEQVAAGSDQVSCGAQALSQGATEQASSVEELAATINEVSVKINANSDDAANATQKTDAAGEEMKNATQKVEELVIAMSDIQRSSDETKNIIKTIEDIAFQTNILALNAAVEAARAGAAGKGFAIVADEVRNLAGKSADAAKNTTALIEGTVTAINKGNTLVEEIAQRITAVSTSTSEIVVINQKISEASKEAAESIDQITVGINQISDVVQTNSATAQESAAASEELSGQAQMLKTVVSEFKLDTSLS